MRKKTNGSPCLTVSIVAFLIFSLSFLIMPVDAVETEQKLSAVVAGVMFWFGLIVGIVAQVTLSIIRKNWFTQNRIRPSAGNQPQLGLLSFFKNKTASIFDIFLILSLLGLVVVIVLTEANGYVCFVCIALLSFSFCGHCIFNGKNYYFVYNRESLKNETKKARINSSKRERRKQNAER